MWVVRLIRAVLSAGLAILLIAGSVQAAGAPGGVDHDWIRQVEVSLTQAAVNSPKWHSKRESLQRDVDDISYFLEQAWKASRESHHTAVRENAQQALALLHRAVARGHFRPEDIEPVLALIRKYLPDASISALGLSHLGTTANETKGG